MTNDEIRVAIAESLGWTVINETLCDPKPEVRHGKQTGGVDINPTAPLPNYPEDLNAIREVVLDLKQSGSWRQAFVNHLQSDTYDSFEWVTQPAIKWCEAYLRTIGRWSDSTPAKSPPSDNGGHREGVSKSPP